MNNRKILTTLLVAAGVLACGIYLFLRVVITFQKEKTAVNKPVAQELTLEEKNMPASVPIQEEERKIHLPFPEMSEQEKEISGLIDKLNDEDTLVSQEAADKLASLGKEAVPVLIKRLKEVDTGLKGQIVFLLGRIGDKEAGPSLRETLKDENAYIRRNAAQALGKIKDTEALNDIATSLFDEDNSVRTQSAWALGETNDARAVDSLLNKMPDEKDEQVQTEMVRSLGKLKDTRATLTLVNVLKEQNDQLYKNEVVTALGEIGDNQALEDLTAYSNKLQQELDKLKEEKADPMLIFQQELAFKTAQEAIEKIKKNNE